MSINTVILRKKAWIGIEGLIVMIVTLALFTAGKCKAEFAPDSEDRALARKAEDTKEEIEDFQHNVARMGGPSQASNEMLLHLENKLADQQSDAANAAEGRGTRAIMRDLQEAR